MELREFNAKKDDYIDQFVSLFNEVALTSVDPYEQMDQDKVRTHFANNTFLAYYLNSPIGYCITTFNENQQIGAIAGIGIHHKHRGKKFSSAIMVDIISLFEEKGMKYIQCDVLKNNEASLGLFNGLQTD